MKNQSGMTDSPTIFRNWRLGALLAALCLAASPVQAETTEEEDGGPHFQALFGNPKGQCYERVYDDAHMASHPRQTIVAIRVDRILTYKKRKETWPAGANHLEVSVRFRDKPKKTYSGGADCGTDDDGKSLRCASDSCDGGHFVVEGRGENILVKIPENFTIIPLCGDPNEKGYDGPRGILAKDDNAIFLMRPVKDGSCSTRFLVTD
jgi:hypothetical protein